MQTEAVHRLVRCTGGPAALRPYVAVGLANACVSFATYASLISLDITIWWANLGGIGASIFSGVLLGRKFVFATDRVLTALVWRYAFVLLGQYVVGSSVIQMLVSIGLSPVVAYVFAVAPMMATSYAGQRSWVFTGGPPATSRVG